MNTSPAPQPIRVLETIEDHGVGVCITCGDALERGQSVVHSAAGIEHADHVDEPLQPALPAC
ncbi:hypothetical protein PCC79_08265 [Propioniciclava soli]|uniref:C2H2-type domain-containing protein n=1 Tax=Propioniciclava soli TaxID=2775081 RepID=A0ABZ3CF32_9ACTN